MRNTTGFGLRCAGFVLALALAAGGAVAADAERGKILYYRNPMGLPDTSQVPKTDGMGMDYVPVYEQDVAEGAGTVRINAERVQKLGVRTAPAQRQDMARTIHAVGTIQPDETRQTAVSPRFNGWIENLRADATGKVVKKGEPMFDFYSPEVVEIEAEYPVSAQAGSLTRLRRLAVPEEEITRLQHERTVNHHIAYRAPVDGTVVEKNAVDGMKFSPGDMLFRLVDLSRVWVIVSVFEQDLGAVALGQAVKVTLPTFTSRDFAGQVDFIYPDVNKDTRTAKVRIALPNPDGALRLDMFASVTIDSVLRENALTVAASAVMDSGARQTVLLDLGDGRFRPQAVKLGARNGDRIEILDGIKDGDFVVTSANFLIDSESNLRAALQNFVAPEVKQ